MKNAAFLRVALLLSWVSTPALAQNITFQPASTCLPLNGAIAVAAGDFTGSGRADIAVADSASSSVSVYLAHGDGAYSAPAAVAIPGGCTVSSLSTADFNGDGHVDILAVCGAQPISSWTEFSSLPISVTIRDQDGVVIGTSTVSLPPNGHTSFVLPEQFAATGGRSGTIEFDTPGGAQISILGLRFAPNLAFTTIPVLTSSQTTGGTFAHLAVAGGWETTFTLVNTGASAATAQLSFLDEHGNPLMLPLGFPQSANMPATQASSLSLTLAAGATQVIDSQNPMLDTVSVGSAQLTTTGNISGFAIFRDVAHGQEAVVPMEPQTAQSNLLVFDDTRGYVTGVAVGNASSQPEDITVTIRDSAGARIGAGTLHLPGNGHASFVLPQKFAATASRIGTLEFTPPRGGQVSVLGLRFAPGSAFTTIPVLLSALVG